MEATRPQVSARHYRAEVERAVQKYCREVTPLAKGSVYLELLQANTDRLQGTLVLLGYAGLEGRDHTMIAQAAVALELLHAYTICMEQGRDTDQAIRAMHEAQILLANLETDEENRLKALSITNRTLMLSALAREGKGSETERLQWRATELTLNPLHVGQVLAGADCHATNAVTPAALSLGYALLDVSQAPLHYQAAREAIAQLPPLIAPQTRHVLMQLVP
jgi:hypothetical protein